MGESILSAVSSELELELRKLAVSVAAGTRIAQMPSPCVGRKLKDISAIVVGVNYERGRTENACTCGIPPLCGGLLYRIRVILADFSSLSTAYRRPFAPWIP
jgi:hypothetical protein